MKPRTLSASSLETAKGCLARFRAENIDFIPRTGDTSAADVGTSVHGALELFVKAHKIDKTMMWNLDELVLLYRMQYRKTFDTSDEKTAEFRDGLSLVKKWFARTDLVDITVLSVETKTRMPVPTSQGDIPFTYIWDRCDEFIKDGKTIIRIVDYKTIRADLGPEDLRAKLQAKIYAVAAAIQFKEYAPDEIWVQFDLLRHETVSIMFNRDELIETWRMLIGEAERILAASYVDPPETLNPGCGWCVRKASCKTLLKNVNGGGVFSTLPIESVMKMSQEITDQMKGLKNLSEELDGFLLEYAKVNDTFAWDSDTHVVKTTSRNYRRIDPLDVYRAVGGEVFAAYGKINIGDVDKLLLDETIPEDRRRQVESSISKERGAPSFNVKRKS